MSIKNVRADLARPCFHVSIFLSVSAAKAPVIFAARRRSPLALLSKPSPAHLRAVTVGETPQSGAEISGALSGLAWIVVQTRRGERPSCEAFGMEDAIGQRAAAGNWPDVRSRPAWGARRNDGNGVTAGPGIATDNPTRQKCFVLAQPELRMRLISLLAGLAIGVAPLGALGAEASGRMSIGVTIVNNACSVGTARCQSPVPTAPRVTAPNYVTYRAATSIAPAVWTRTY